MAFSKVENLAYISLYVGGNGLENPPSNYRGAVNCKELEPIEEDDVDKLQLPNYMESISSLVNTSCYCKTSTICSSRSTTVYHTEQLLLKNLSENSDDEDSEDEATSLQQILTALVLFEKKDQSPLKANLLRTLLSNDLDSSVLAEEEICKVIEFLEHNNVVLKECSLLLLCKLCCQKSIAIMFLLHDVMAKLFDLLELETSDVIINLTGSCMVQILAHQDLTELWLEQMMSIGVGVLTHYCDGNFSAAKRLSSGKTLQALSVYVDLMDQIKDRLQPTLSNLCSLGKEGQIIYAGIVAGLLKHMDVASLRLGSGLYDTVTMMLRKGSCSVQRQAICLVNTLLKRKSQDVDKLLQNKIFPLVWSSWIDSQCRSVREKSISLVIFLLQNITGHKLKDVLIQVDQGYFHRPCLNEDRLENLLEINIHNPGKQQALLARCCERAVTKTLEQIIQAIHQEGEINKSTKVVHLMPTVNVDTTRMNCLSHLVRGIKTMCSLGVSPIKVPLERTADMQEKLLLKTIKNNYKPEFNHQIIRSLMSSGGLCLVDLLFTYSVCLKPASPTNSKPTQVWAHSSRKPGIHVTRECKPSLSDVFTVCEISLIQEIIDVLGIYTKCSSECKESHLEAQVKKKLEVENTKHTNHVSHYGNIPTSLLGYIDDSDSSDGDEIIGLEEEDRPDMDDFDHKKKTLEMQYKTELKKEISQLHRKVRTCLMDAGIVDALVPLLHCSDMGMKHEVMMLMQQLIQPLKERVPAASHVPMTTCSLTRKQRPMSAMTSKERDHAMQLAMNQMSQKVKCLVQEALVEEAKSEPHTSSSSNNEPSGDCQPHQNVSCIDSRTDISSNGDCPARTVKDANVSLNQKPCTNGDLQGNMQLNKNKSTKVPTRPASAKPINHRPCSAKASEHRVKAKDKKMSQIMTSTNNDNNSQQGSCQLGQTLVPKGKLDHFQQVSPQCRQRLLRCGAHVILDQLFSPAAVVKVQALVLLEQLALHGNVEDISVLSRAGLCSKLLDFIRLNESDTELVIMALLVAQSMLKVDVRMGECIQQGGGYMLLVSMASYSTGPLRTEISRTLHMCGKGRQRAATTSRRVQSAPVGGLPRQPPDVWDKIMFRWKEEDKVSQILRKPLDLILERKARTLNP